MCLREVDSGDMNQVLEFMMAKLLPAKLVDLWKMEFRTWKVLWETWKSTWQWKLCWISERKKISQDRIRWNMKEDRSKSLRD